MADHQKVIPSLKKCDLCKQESKTDEKDTVNYGEWMSRSDVSAHYYCLLLSTNLPQRGEDHSGILGFLLCDIRKEINSAKKRKCIYCDSMSATISCCKCKNYFHLTCGLTNRALFQFVGDFRSYCKTCLPLHIIPDKLIDPPDPKRHQCTICYEFMGVYRHFKWIYCKRCGYGYAHSVCMKKYALGAGYYLICIWCKSKTFREDVKELGIFVPDREAKWENRTNFLDLHRGHSRCDMEICLCPKGKDYQSTKWQVTICKLCGLNGAHNPYCIPGMEHSKTPLPEFKCDTCSTTEHTLITSMLILNESQNVESDNNLDTTLFIHKQFYYNDTHKNDADLEFSDDSTSSSSFVTVINSGTLKHSTSKNVYTLQTENMLFPLLTQPADTEILPTSTTMSTLQPGQEPSTSTQTFNAAQEQFPLLTQNLNAETQTTVTKDSNVPTLHSIQEPFASTQTNNEITPLNHDDNNQEAVDLVVMKWATKRLISLNHPGEDLRLSPNQCSSHERISLPTEEHQFSASNISHVDIKWAAKCLKALFHPE